MSIESKLELVQKSHGAEKDSSAMKRLQALFDDGSFTEIDSLAKSGDAPAEVIAGFGAVEGYPVYDCDSQAKRIMDNDAEIQRQLQNAFGEDVVVDGVIHRQKLASLVFGNSENLRKLNAIVHPAVIADIKKWSVAEQKDLVFVETAILRESGMETLVDEVWVVDAPKDIRVARVMVRNNMPEEDVRKRIDSQNDNPKFSVPTSVVENYGSNSVIVQVQNLLKTMFNKQNTK